jgi:hypothetical protein
VVFIGEGGAGVAQVVFLLSTKFAVRMLLMDF